MSPAAANDGNKTSYGPVLSAGIPELEVVPFLKCTLLFGFVSLIYSDKPTVL